MSSENVEIIRRSQDHFTRSGDLAWDVMDPDLEVHDHDLPDAVAYRGHQGLRDWTAHWADAWESFEMGSEDYVDAGDRVVMLFTMRATGKGSGIEVERDDAIIFSLTDGRITRIDYYNSQPQALEAVGLSR